MGHGKMCPALNTFCYLDWCQTNGMCKQQKGYTVDAKGHSHPVSDKGDGANIETTVWCDVHKAHCGNPECVNNERCKIEQKEADDMANKPTRLCPAAVGTSVPYCQDEGCIKHDKCFDEIWANDIQGQGAPTSWTCPTDNKPCQLRDCAIGNDCWLKKKHKYSGTVSVSPPCHEGLYSLGKIKKAEIIVGKESHVKLWVPAEHGKIGLIIGLLGDAYEQEPIVGMNDKAKLMGMDKVLSQAHPIAPNIWLKWPDFGAVRFDTKWWKALAKVVEKVEGPVIIYCMGGHGRTGTCAAILCSLLGIIPEDKDPVQWVRDNYCEKVVESEEQIAYIENITGRKVRATAAKSYYGGFSSPTIYKNKDTSKSKPKEKGPPGVAPPDGSLSKRKWKKWWMKVPKNGIYHAIANVTRATDLPDGQTFVIGSRTWKWSAKDNCFWGV